MAEKHYSEDEKKTLRVLKMQEGDLKRLQDSIAGERQTLNQINDKLNAIKERAKLLASESDVDLPEERHYPVPTTPQEENKIKIKKEEIPSWRSLEKRASQATEQETYRIEDLLTGEEIAYARDEVKRITDEFASRTGLNKRDIAFLSVATSIQTARWAMTPKLVGQLGKSGKVLAALSPSAVAMLEQKPKGKELALIDETNREFVEDADAEEINAERKTWEEILQQKDKTPTQTFNNDAMNWIFGIVNKITGTATGSNFTSVNATTGESINTARVFSEAFRSIKEDPKRLSAAVFAQYVQDRASHGETVDFLSPATEALQPEMEGELFKSQVQQLATMANLNIVGKQAAFPLIINMAVGLLHGYMYNPATDGPRQFYDARTRKILLLSNLMATSTNLAFSAGTTNWAKLDLGGLLVAGTRTLQDIAYITNLEDHFLRHQMDKVYEKELQDIDRHFQNEIIKVEE